MNTQTLDCLEEAKKLIGAGWCQKNYIRKKPDGGYEYCSSGAIILSTPDLNVVRCAAAFLKKVTDSNVSILRWNDAPERTHEEVLAAFDRAIDLAKGEVVEGQ